MSVVMGRHLQELKERRMKEDRDVYVPPPNRTPGKSVIGRPGEKKAN